LRYFNRRQHAAFPRQRGITAEKSAGNCRRGKHELSSLLRADPCPWTDDRLWDGTRENCWETY
jgi:hypothetical protein